MSRNHINLDWFSFWAGIVPDQKAVTVLEEGTTYTYGNINENGERIANYLYYYHGIRQGDRIGILSKNNIENIYLFSAAMKIGAVLVPLNYRLTNYELSFLVSDAELSILFYDIEFSVAGLNVNSQPLRNINDFECKELPPEILYSSEEPIFILYTSGSTGVPKGVLYTHQMMYWNSMNTSVSLGVNSNSCALVCMPPFHTGGWNVLLTPVLHHGGHIVLAQKFDAEQILIALEEYHCDQFMAVPTMLKMMASAPAFSEVALGSLPYVIVGGEAMSVDLIKIYEAKSISVRQGFGMTEAGPNLTSLHHEQSMVKIGSIGKPNMYVNVKLIDEFGEEVPRGQLGELCFSGPVVMPSYWKNKVASDGAVINDWLRSGDIAMMDGEGYLYIKDRKKNMYISGGENVYPAEVEKELRNHPHIKDVAVVGVFDEKWGEVGKAFIVCSMPVSADELKVFCLDKISKFKIPKYFEFLEQLPLNATGKIDRKALRELG